MSKHWDALVNGRQSGSRISTDGWTSQVPIGAEARFYGGERRTIVAAEEGEYGAAVIVLNEPVDDLPDNTGIWL